MPVPMSPADERIDHILQPLRIPPGWRVDSNLFTELDPNPENMEYFYGSWLFAASDVRSRVGVELVYEPEGDPTGDMC